MRFRRKAALESSAAATYYAEAYATHYGERDVPAAVRAYAGVIATHAGSPEERYARSQIENIVRTVVPAHALLAAYIELALRHGLPPVGLVGPAGAAGAGAPA